MSSQKDYEMPQNPVPELGVQGLESVPFSLRSKELAGYIAMMSPERQEAFEIELAQRRARLLLQSRQQMDVLGKREESVLNDKMEDSDEESSEFSLSESDIDVDDNSMAQTIYSPFTNLSPGTQLSPQLVGQSSQRSGTLMTQNHPLENDGVPSRIDKLESNRYLPVLRQSGASKAVILAADSRRIRDRKYICDICGDTLTSRQNLKNHINSHMGVSPYRCTQCHKTYRHPQSLRRHEAKAHAIEGVVRPSRDKKDADELENQPEILSEEMAINNS